MWQKTNGRTCKRNSKEEKWGFESDFFHKYFVTIWSIGANPKYEIIRQEKTWILIWEFSNKTSFSRLLNIKFKKCFFDDLFDNLVTNSIPLTSFRRSSISNFWNQNFIWIFCNLFFYFLLTTNSIESMHFNFEGFNSNSSNPFAKIFYFKVRQFIKIEVEVEVDVFKIKIIYFRQIPSNHFVRTTMTFNIRRNGEKTNNKCLSSVLFSF